MCEFSEDTDAMLTNIEIATSDLIRELKYARKRNAELKMFERDAKRWRWIEERLAYHQIPGQMAEGWTLDEIYPGEDAGKAIDAFIKNEYEG